MTGITSLDTVSQNQSNLSSRATTASDVTSEPMRPPTPFDLAANQSFTGRPTAVLPPVT
ncbi:hypothetical protein ACFWAX_23700 [Streptomyces sp. NPDC059956]|uniref:hypothetical protein n=1 Tax=Streptomyces sp. NPDC059956 TaxID=3347015 RepID=UPI0036553354